MHCRHIITTITLACSLLLACGDDGPSTTGGTETNAETTDAGTEATTAGSDATGPPHTKLRIPSTMLAMASPLPSR